MEDCSCRAYIEASRIQAGQGDIVVIRGARPPSEYELEKIGQEARRHGFVVLFLPFSWHATKADDELLASVGLQRLAPAKLKRVRGR